MESRIALSAGVLEIPDNPAIASPPGGVTQTPADTGSDDSEHAAGPAVVGRHLFYNNSRFDDPVTLIGDEAVNAADDAAIASDKAPLMPGVMATFDNYTGYSRGINGIMVDIADAAGTLTVADFEFRVGNTDDPNTWTSAPPISGFDVRPGAGTDGSDRVTITWADGAIRNQWLQVTVLANENTGLSTPDVHYWGNQVGETGNNPTTAVDGSDSGGVVNNASAFSSVDVTNRYDLNKSGFVDGADTGIVVNNATGFGSLTLFVPSLPVLPEALSSQAFTGGSLIGVDLGGGTTPTNWNTFNGSTDTTISSLIDEAGVTTSVDVFIDVDSSPGASQSFSPSASHLPIHTQALSGIDSSYFDGSGNIELTFSNLTPGQDYEIYVFGGNDIGASHTVTITGQSVVNFNQNYSANETYINDELGDSSRDLSTFAELVAADGSGEILVRVAGPPPGLSVAALAIRESAPATHDFGDAPSAAQSGFASSYPVTLAADGARHLDTGPTLGDNRDIESDGVHSDLAIADDITGPTNDEEGVNPRGLLMVSTDSATTGYFSVNLRNPDPTSNRLDAWIDWNRDGDWDDPDEQIFSDADLGTSGGFVQLGFAIPHDTGANVEDGLTYGRFRLSTTGGLGVTGEAADGEVEDHAFTIESYSPFAPPVLSELDGTSGFRLDGEQDSDFSGFTSSGAGDFNGDGIDDIIVGARLADPNGTTDAGATYVVFWPELLNTPIELSSLDGTNGFRLDGVNADDSTAWSVSGLGDIDNDGFDDIIIGSRFGNGSGSASGAAYVLLGVCAGFSSSISLSSISAYGGFKLEGPATDSVSGWSVSGAGDLNNDGFEDLLVAVPFASPGSGATYVVFGTDAGFGSLIDLTSLNGTNGFRIDEVASGDQLGAFHSVSSAGDFNADGFDDLILGARGAANSGAGSGSAWILYGTNSFASAISLSGLNGPNGFRIDAEAAGDELGLTVNELGDVNGDGFDDVIMGARLASPGGSSQAGASYVLFGASTGFGSTFGLTSLNGSNGFRIDGEAASDQSGLFASGAGDINADGFDDIAIGARLADPDGLMDAGAAYLIFGASGGFGASLDLGSISAAEGFRIAGENAGDHLGRSISIAGDIDADGFDDLVIGADFADPNGVNASGATYAVFGKQFSADVGTQVGRVIDDVLIATQGAAKDTLIGSYGDDTLISDGGADVLRGAFGDDQLIIPDTDFSGTRRLQGGSGIDTLVLSGSGLSLDLTAIPDNRIVDIEEIDLRGTGPNTLTLDPREVLNISTNSNRLIVRRNRGDTVNIGSGWTQQSNHRRGADSFEVFTQGAATLMVQLPSSIQLSSLDGTSGFRIDGVAEGDRSGRAVSNAGDINGDGFDDLLVGAENVAHNGATDAGAGYVVFGASGGFTSAVDLSALNGTNGFRLTAGTMDGLAGAAVDGGGDINGDGIDDLIISAPGDNPDGTPPGTVWVVFGKSAGFSSSVDLSALDGQSGFRVDSDPAGSFAGFDAGHAGDVNGDGADDLIIGNLSTSYVVFGSTTAFASAIALTSLNGSNGFRLNGEPIHEGFGRSVSGAGDINGDGFDDLLIGAYRADVNGTDSGSAYIVFGQSGGFASVVSMSALNGSNGFRLDGRFPEDRFGRGVGSAGDVNGDGLDDLIVGASWANHDLSDSGTAYVLFGQSSGFASRIDITTLNGTNGFRLDGVDRFDLTGVAVDSAGDVNGDGFDDLLVGAFAAAVDGEVSGAAYLVFGGSGGFGPSFDLSSLDGSNGIRLDGSDDSRSGRSVSRAGDVNGDGFDDVIIGAYGASYNGSFSGASYVVFGSNFTGGVETQVGDAAANTLNAAQGAGIDVLIGGGNEDTLTSDGGADVLRGGEGEDGLSIPDTDFSGTRRLVGGNGIDTLILSGNGLTLDLTAIPDNRIVDIEQIDITGSGPNTLTLDVREVLNISSHSNTLIVRRGLGDTVNIGTGWTQQADETIDGQLFEVFTQDAATLRIQNPATLSLAQLDGSNGFRLDGIDAADESGRSVSGAGDVNGDGLDDLIIGARSAAPAGESYVVFGKSNGFSSAVDLSSLNGSNGFRLDGIDSFDFSGNSVSTAGDVNGDGFDDLIVAAYRGHAPASDSGEVYVVFGASGGFASAVDLSSLNGSNGFRLDGIDLNDLTGNEVSDAGDVNGDGYGDLIIGALAGDAGALGSGETFVVFGNSGGFASALDLSSLNGSNGFRLDGVDVSDRSGISVNSAGDLNGDGFDDVIIGASDADPGADRSGESYIVFGRSGGFSSAIDLSSLDGTSGFRLDGINVLDLSGISVSSAGDVNGDGFDDVIAGAPFANADVVDAGESYVVFGSSGGFLSALDLSSLNGSNGFRVDGIDVSDHAGMSVSSAGDVNADGFDDLLIGAFFGDASGSNSGESYVVFGHSGGFASALKLSSLDGSNGLLIVGVDADDRSGRSVSDAGDVNGDGFDDLIIGAYDGDDDASDSGESYVVFGGNFTGGVETQVGDATRNTLTATQGAGIDVLIGGLNDDTLISDGGADVLRGGEGNDGLSIPDVDFSSTRRLQGGNGIDTLLLSGAGLTLDLTTIADNRVNDIEAIDLRGTGPNTLTLDVQEVLNISTHSNTLLVRRHLNDTVNIGSGWTKQADEFIDGNLFEVFTQGAATLQVQYPATLSLAQLNGSNGIRLDGINPDDWSGVSVSGAGDINGDGFDDLIVGASQTDTQSPETGETYVVFGSAGGFASALDLSALNGSNGFRLDGIDINDDFGRSVSDAGDLNGDGLDDLIIGAPDGDTDATNSGESYVVFGRSNGFTSALNLSSLDGSNGFRIDGISINDSSGNSVSGAGDVNGDGFHDIVIGAAVASAGDIGTGEIYVVFGHPGGFTSSLDLSSLDGSNGFRLDGIDFQDFSGRSVSSAGDVNGDGFSDIIVGADNADGGATNSGESYIVFGKSGGYASALNLATLNGSSGFRLNGVAAGDESGYSVSGAGDVNGDGFDDLIIGAYLADPGGLSSGESYVVFGKSGGFSSALDLSSLNGSTGFRLAGTAEQHHSGRSVSGAGDVNADGFDDLIIGARFADADGFRNGETYIIFGRSGGFTSALDLSSLNGNVGIRIDGIDTADLSGYSVSNAGDVNGDGFDDAIVGAFLADPNGVNRAGESYVIFGSNLTGGVETQVGDATGNNLTAAQGAAAIDILIGAQGDDTLISDGGADILRGGEGDDGLSIPDTDFSGARRLVGGNGIDTLLLNGSGLTLDLTTISDNRIVDIEQIDIRGTGANTLTLDVQEVLNISSHSNTLLVRRSPSDTVNIGSGWSEQADELIDGSLFEVFTQGAATLKVQTEFVADLSVAMHGSEAGPVDIVFQVTLNRTNITGSAITFDLDDLFTGTATSGSDYVTIPANAQISVADSTMAGTLTVTVLDDALYEANDVNAETVIAEISGASHPLVTIGTATATAFLTSDESLFTLNGSNGFRLDGISTLDQSGSVVSDAGDVNGDGFDDVIVGAWAADPDGKDSAGESYVVFGKSGGLSSAIDLSDLNGTNGFRIDGIDESDFSGRSVSSAGDVNGDGIDDLIIGADGGDPNSTNLAGESYVLFGTSGGFASVVKLSSLNGTNGFRIDGVSAYDRSARSVSNAGDVNGDGLDDLIIGARSADPGGNNDAGESYVVFSATGGFTSAIDLSALNGTNGFRINGIDPSDQSGNSVSAAGDINGDGFDDVIIGASAADPDGMGGGGETYVVFGSSAPFASSIDLSGLNGTNGFRLDGIDSSDSSGVSVSSAGDINGDGFDDLVIGAQEADPDGNSRAGESYVVFGKSSGFASAVDLSTLNGSNGFRIDGIDSIDRSGGSVSGAGDVNGDGFDDLIIGARTATYLILQDAGESHVLFGKSGGFASAVNLSSLTGSNGFRLGGLSSLDQSGVSVSGAGDVNGDGFDDVIVGAHFADPGGSIQSGGESYVVFGGNFSGGPETQVGDSAANVLTAVQGAAAIDILIGGQNDDLLISDGGADVLRGGEGDDGLSIPDVDFGSTRRLQGGNGVDTLILNGSGLTLDLTTIPDNRIVDIEEIDITGTGANTLTLNVMEVLRISTHSNTLVVRRGFGDTVNIGTGWTQQADEIIDSDPFEVFTQGAATLKVRAPVETTVGLDASGNLLIQDINGANSDDNLTVSVNGTSIRVHDATNTLAALTGAVQVDASTVDVLISGITGTTGIIVDTLGGDDTLTVDFSGGNFTRAIDFQGGSNVSSNPGDQLILQGGGTFSTATFGFVNASSGSVDITGNSTITYTGLEPVTSNITATAVTLNYSDTAETLTVTDAGSGQTTVTSDTAAETVTFDNPTGTLTINAGDTGNDVINIDSLASGFSGNLTINGQTGEDTVNVNGNVSLAAGRSLDVTADTINVGATVITTGNGTVTLTADRNIAVTSGASVSTVDGGISLDANTAQTSSGHFVGVKIEDADITTTGDGHITIDGTGGDLVQVGQHNHGVLVSGGSVISSAKTSLGAGRVDITGLSKSLGSAVMFVDSETAVRTDTGWIRINGTADTDPNSATTFYGVEIISGATLESIGTDSEAGLIQVDGTGTASSKAGGLFLRQATVTAINRKIDLDGESDGGQYGIRISDGAIVSSTGTTEDAADIRIAGRALSSTGGAAVWIANPSGGGAPTVTSVAGNTSVSGVGGVSDVGLLIDDDAHLQTETGGLSLDGDGGAGGILFNSGNVIATGNAGIRFEAQWGQMYLGGNTIGGTTATGDIFIEARDLNLATDIQSTGTLTIHPFSDVSVGLGGGAGDLSLDDTELAHIVDGFSSIVIGMSTELGDEADGTSTIDIDTATFNDPVTIAGGMIHDNDGTDLVAPNTTLIGNVSPGQSPGILSVAGNLTLADNDTFTVEIGGTSAGTANTNHDQLHATGSVDIGSDVTLDVSAFNGFVPQSGQQFVIISRTGGTGTFDGLAEGAIVSTNFLGSGLTATITYAGGDGDDVVISMPAVAASIEGRHLFYNTSRYDDPVTQIGDPAINANDDAAIDTSKSALMPNTLATFQNYSGYSRGINGIMIDIAGAPGTITAADFEFKVGNSSSPAGWASAPAHSGFDIRPGEGNNGSDRITFTWADGAISGQWLQVTVLANGNTGLATPDVHYWGNQPGETGNSPTTSVDGSDVGIVINNPSGFTPATVDNPYDVNKSGFVDGADVGFVVNNPTGFSSLLLFTPPGPPPAAAPDEPVSGSPEATALVTPDSTSEERNEADVEIVGLSSSHPSAEVPSEGTVAIAAGFRSTGPAVRAVFVDWGDGSGEDVVAVNDDNTIAADHIYLEDGTFIITVTAMDQQGRPATAQTFAVVARQVDTADRINSASPTLIAPLKEDQDADENWLY